MPAKILLRVAIGRTGATKLQYLEIGKGTCQHGLIAGKTGSGKSTLFHVIITNLSLWCSPEQVEFYLVDFKKGVEFKCYATRRLPHARVVAIESDREFALSVLQRVDDELRHRGDLFRQLGVQDLAGYKKAGGKEAIPRTLLLIDEFQEYFVEDDKIAQTASLLLDRVVRQGRAFGIHVLLGSQTLGGAYTVARTTLGQMVIRIALQCNEADAYLIMDDTNPAPRLLSRPGEGIYNDMAGALEGNSPFQVVWLPEEVRDAQLTRVRARASALTRARDPRTGLEVLLPPMPEVSNPGLAELSFPPRLGEHGRVGVGVIAQFESQVAIDELKMAIEVNEWARQYKPRMICFAKYATMSVAERLSQSGHKIQDMSGTVFYQACSDLYDAIVNGRIVHAGQQTLVDSMNNCAAKESDAGWRIVRRKSAGDVSAAISLAMMVHQLLKPQSKPQIYA